MERSASILFERWEHVAELAVNKKA